MTPFMRSAALSAVIIITTVPAFAQEQTHGPAPAAKSSAPCGGDFDTWMQGVRAEARAAGVSDQAISSGLDGVRIEPKVLAADRSQSVFQQTFLEFANRMAGAPRPQKGAQLLKQRADLFGGIEKQYGVQGAVIAAFWGLETDFGGNLGKFDTRNALATLSHDCRRPDFFRPQLIAVLKIIDRGDLAPTDMRGAWAGELGQTQMMPVDYLRDGVDADGDGRIDLMRSVPDALTSAGKYLADLGWRRSEPWIQEVVVPAEMPWQEADIEIKHLVSDWKKWGVKARTGQLFRDNAPAALLLPMGRNGPAFLAYQNFDVYRTWNQSFVYGLTAAYLATRLDGAPVVAEGNAPVRALNTAELKQLQTYLAREGWLPADEIDGKLGFDTRRATRKAQAKYGMPQDGYPSIELVQAMASGG